MPFSFLTQSKIPCYSLFSFCNTRIPFQQPPSSHRNLKTMANAVLTRTPSPRSCIFKTRATPSSLPSAQLKLCATRKDGPATQRSIFINRKIPRLRPYHAVESLDASDVSALEDAASDFPLESSQEWDDGKCVWRMIREFYDCVNGENVDRIGELVSEDCWFDDYSFSQKIEGRKEVCNFFNKLTKAMGETVKFQIEEISGGCQYVGCAIWYLEWKKKRIPFTKGCTFFKCSKEGDKLVIREARVLIESPIKPGVVAVGLLDLVRSAFDMFPNFTRWFLRRPQAILDKLVNIYSLAVAPFINPLLVFYIPMLRYIYKGIYFMIRFLRMIAKNLK